MERRKAMKFGLITRDKGKGSDVDQFRKHINSLFDDFFSPGPTGFFDTDWAPAVDIEEGEKGYIVRAEMPGMSEKDISVTVENHVLTIQGEKKEEKERKEGNRLIVSERSYGSFRRSFSLPRSTDPGSIKAEFKNGVLTVNVPRAKTAPDRQITINVN